ncbi:MAG TPA: hypothetical protein VGT03_07810 [Candidatus Acidoferrales bacterium]|nr:hypothetical protein [Candidatus Acidoferrales bacterium]
MPHPLDGVKAKIERAIEHIEHFAVDANTFERSAYSLRPEPDIELGRLHLFLVDNGLSDPPFPLRLLAAEIAHQLRSSLDHIVFILANKAAERDRQFPIYKEPKKYKTSSPAMIKGVSARAKAIIEKAQPFQSSTPDHHPLWMLHELNNTDKHKVIPACSIYTSQAKIDFTPGPIYFINFEGGKRVVEGSAKLGYVPLPSGYTPEMKMNSESLFTVAFKEIGTAKFEPAVPLPYQMLSVVSGLYDQFMGEF